MHLLAVDTPTVTVSAVLAVLVAAAVAGVVRYFFDDALARRTAFRDAALARDKADLDAELARKKAALDDDLATRQASREFDLERRKALRTLISGFDGRLMEAAADFHFRLRNLYSGVPAGWLEPESPELSGYFYR